MKNLLIILSCLLAAATSNAQIISKSLAQDSVLYLTPAQEAFMIDKETKSLFKLTPFVGFEQKVTEDFSLNLALNPKFFARKGNNDAVGGVSLKSSLELRNYFRLSNLIKKGKQANNLSSVYYGVGYEHERSVGDFLNFFNLKRKLYGVIGSQKRFLNYGYIDYGVRLSFEKKRFDNRAFNFGRNINGVSLSSFTRVGFAFGKRYKIAEEAKCPIFKCYVDRKSAFKVDLNRDFNIFYGQDFQKASGNVLSINVNPNIGYEVKLGDSPFSFDQNLDVNLTTNTNGEYFFRARYNVGFRYYYNLNKNIRKGKSGNNLSGWYVLGRSRIQYTNFDQVLFSPYGGEYGRTNGEKSFASFELGIGYQKTLLNNLYFDIDFSFFTGLHTLDASDRDLDEIASFNFKVGKYF